MMRALGIFWCFDDVG